MEKALIKIQRNKFLTTIRSGSITRKIPTKRFDEVLGSSDDVLPEYNPIPDLPTDRALLETGSTKMMDFNVDINGVTVSTKSLMEFSDLSYRLFCSSLVKSSTGFLSDEYLNKLTQVYAEAAISKAAGIPTAMRFSNHNEFGMLKNGSANGGAVDSLIPVLFSLENRYGFDPKEPRFLSGDWIGIADIIKDRDKTAKYIQRLVDEYNSKIAEQVFVHKNGEELTINGTSFEEVMDIYIGSALSKFNQRCPDAKYFESESPIQTYAKSKIECLNLWIEVQNAKKQVKLELFENMVPKEVKDLLDTIGVNGVNSNPEKLYLPLMEAQERISSESPEATM